MYNGVVGGVVKGWAWDSGVECLVFPLRLADAGTILGKHVAYPSERVCARSRIKQTKWRGLVCLLHLGYGFSAFRLILTDLFLQSSQIGRLPSSETKSLVTCSLREQLTIPS
jgi:hypothetical protein